MTSRGCGRDWVAHRWVTMPHRMHSNLVVRMVFPRVRTLKPASSQSTLSAPLDGIRECSSSDTWAAPFAPQAGHLRSMVQLSRITIPLSWLEYYGDAEAADLQSILQPRSSMALSPVGIRRMQALERPVGHRDGRVDDDLLDK